MSKGPTARITCITAALVLFLACGSGLAALLPVGGSYAGVVPAELDPTGGLVVAGGVPVPFATATYSGSLTTTVIAGDPSNPFGGLTFTYKLHNDPGSVSSLGRMTNLDFTGFLTDVSYQVPVAVGDVIPTNVDRFSPVTVGWEFISTGVGGLGKILPGQDSALLVIQTNATAYTQIFANVINGSQTQVSSLGPLIPEPVSMGLMGGLALLLGRRRRA